jgi:uncharacterized membrane protein
MEFTKQIAEFSISFLEVFGIGIIVIIGVYSTVISLIQLFKHQSRDEIFKKFRQNFGRGILLGLEFLVAADIIRTVAVDFSYKSVGVLAIIVLVRTFLSFTLEVEITGKWPWQQK